MEQNEEKAVFEKILLDIKKKQKNFFNLRYSVNAKQDKKEKGEKHI